MLSNFRSWLAKRSRGSLIYISLVVLALDIFFVLINCYADKAALDSALLTQAQENQKEFSLMLQMTYRNMMQMALYISQNHELNQIFLQGKKAVQAEGGGSGGANAQAARQALLKKVKPAWDELTKAFDIRQLHYHLGPGSLSFLRVHKPSKYGDRMDQLRFIIVDTNKEKTPRHGFETGRIYSGLRGVYPVFTTDPTTGEKVYVGALETGSSFKQLLPAFAKFFDTNVAVLLTKQHIESKMWPEFIKSFFAKNPTLNYYLEASSSKNVRNVLRNTHIKQQFVADTVQLYHQGETYWSVYYFPLRDYLGSTKPEIANAGFVLTWANATDQVSAFIKAIYINIIYAFFAFVIVEIALIWFFTRETKLAIAEREAKFDGLTNILNRRQFDKLYLQEFTKAQKSGIPLSLILCDIDFFKKYNDSYGHLAGDECLKKVTAAIGEHVKRETDFFARYGGEEFVIVLPNTSLKRAELLANEIKAVVEQLKLKHCSPFGIVTLSLGVSSSQSRDSAEALLRKADDNLYSAKEQGRNRVVSA